MFCCAGHEKSDDVTIVSSEPIHVDVPSSHSNRTVIAKRRPLDGVHNDGPPAKRQGFDFNRLGNGRDSITFMEAVFEFLMFIANLSRICHHGNFVRTWMIIGNSNCCIGMPQPFIVYVSLGFW